MTPEDWFVPAQARAWSEIREWAQEAEGHTLIKTKPGGSWDGPGASLDSTAALRAWLPRLFSALQVKTVLDVACGDWNWMQHVDLTGVKYTGWDVDHGRIEKCAQRAAAATLERGPYVPAPHFDTRNMLTVESVPQVDLILCRDFLGHLTNGYITRVLRRFRESGSTWLLASTYPGSANDFEYNPSEYAWLGYMERPVNLQAPPWGMRKVDSLPEECGPGGVLTLQHELGLFKLQNGGR